MQESTPDVPVENEQTEPDESPDPPPDPIPFIIFHAELLGF